MACSRALCCAAVMLATACGGSTIAADQPSPSASYGFVSLFQATSNAAGEYANVNARFYRLDSVVPSSSCRTLASEGYCDLLECPAEASSTTTSPPSLDAGQVSVTAELQIKLKRGADGTYPSSSTTGPLWLPGDVIDIQVQGLDGDPPPFSAKLTGPGPITITQPADSTIVVDRGEDVAFAWSGETTSYVTVQTGRSAGQTRSISCRWAASDESRNVPSAILGGLPAGDTSFEVRAPTSPTTSIIGNWTMNASASLAVTTIAATLQ